jgi:hypothetical protein
MRRLGLCAIAATVLALASCGPADSGYTVHRLPSGRDVKVLSVTKMVLSKGDPALMLKYRTDLRLEDQAQVRKEVEEVWQAFRFDVEQAGLKAAIISVHELPTNRLIVRTDKSYNFVIQKSSRGTWEFLDDRGPRKQAG